MLNFYLLYTLINPKKVNLYIGILCCIGFSVLLDIFILLKLSLLVGSWITIATMAFSTGICILGTYKMVGRRLETLKAMIHDGKFIETVFTNYVAALLASLFLVSPGVVHTALGFLLLFPPISIRVVKLFTHSTGIVWLDAYEYLRLNNISVENNSTYSHS